MALNNISQLAVYAQFIYPASSNGNFPGGQWPGFSQVVLDFIYDDVADKVICYQTPSVTPFVDIIDDIPDYIVMSGATINNGVAVAQINSETGYSYCAGTSLVNFPAKTGTRPLGASFLNTLERGFFEKQFQASHFSCIGTVCDIEFSGEVKVTNAGNPTTADGIVEIFATTSNGTLQYALEPAGTFSFQANFQLSNIFTGLLPGDYVAFIKDSEACQSSQNLNVGITQSDGYLNTRLFYEFCSKRGNQFRFNIKERFDSTITEEVEALASPIVVAYEESEDLFDRIKGSRIECNLKSSEHFKFIYLFDKPDKYYRGELQIDDGGGYRTIWTGYLITGEYTEEFRDPPYLSRVVFGDILGELKTTPFLSSAGETIQGQMSDFNLLMLLLRKLEIDINVRIACNLDAEDYTYNTATETPMHGTYNDMKVYEGLNCEEVIFDLLGFWNARMVQEDGYFWIIRIIDNERPFDYVEFDINGTFVDKQNIDNYVVLERPDPTDPYAGAYYAVGFPDLQLNSAYKEIKLTRDSWARDSVLINGTFEDIFATTTTQITGWTPRNSPAHSTALESLVVAREGRQLQRTFKLDSGGDKYEVWRPAPKGVNKVAKVSGNSIGSWIFTPTMDIMFYPGDSFNFVFTYNVQCSKEVPWVKVKYRVIWGQRYLSKGGTWEPFTGSQPGSDAIQIIYEDNVQQWNNLEISIPTTDAINIGSLGSFYVEIFAVDFYEQVNFAQFDANDSTGDPDGARVITRGDASFPLKLAFWSKDGDVWRQDGKALADQEVGIPTPLGYFGYGNWQGGQINLYGSPHILIDDCFFNIYPNGEELESQFNCVVTNPENFQEKYDETLITGILPRSYHGSIFSQGAEQRDRWIFDYWKRDVNGEPIFRFKRTGAETFLKMDKLIANEIYSKLGINRWSIRSQIFSTGKINFINAIVDLINPITDLGGGDIQGNSYLLTGMNWQPEEDAYEVQMIQIGNAVVNGGVVTPDPDPDEPQAEAGFSEGFSTGHNA